VALVIDKPSLVNGDAMEERNASLARFMYVFDGSLPTLRLSRSIASLGM
jgi:hypothetical protein